MPLPQLWTPLLAPRFAVRVGSCERGAKAAPGSALLASRKPRVPAWEAAMGTLSAACWGEVTATSLRYGRALGRHPRMAAALRRGGARGRGGVPHCASVPAGVAAVGLCGAAARPCPALSWGCAGAGSKCCCTECGAGCSPSTASLRLLGLCGTGAEHCGSRMGRHPPQLEPAVPPGP